MRISALTPEQVFRLIESGADVVAGVYPIKRVNWDKAMRVMESRRPKLPSAALDYVLEIDDPDHVTVVNGFTRVRYAGTGFLMIRRHVFEKMCASAYRSLQFFREHSLDALAGSPNRFALFECMIDPATRNLSQRGFCVLQTLDRYRRRDLGRSREPPRSCRPCGIPRRYLVAVCRPRAGDRCGVRCRPMRRAGVSRSGCADRDGVARLTKMAVAGIDLRPLWQKLIARLIDGTIEPGEGLDLSLIAQLLGDKQAGLAIQDHILASHQLFRSPCAAAKPRLRVLALAAATDIGSNTPIEFLLERSAIELMTLYVVADAELPVPLPDHDVAIVIASDSPDCRDALRKIGAAASRWPRPMLNPPHLVGNLDRDKLHRVLDGIDGLEIPVDDRRVARATARAVTFAPLHLSTSRPILRFPLIVRPRGSHAGAGLAKIDDRDAWKIISTGNEAQEFFVSRFVDYSGDDGSVSQIPDRLCRWPTLRVPHGDRRSLGHLVSQRRHVAQRRQTSRRGNIHAHIRYRLCAPPSDCVVGNRRADRSRLFYGRLCGNQKRIAAGFRG